MPHRIAPRASPPRQTGTPDAPYSLTRAVEEFEGKYVENILQLTNGNCDEAAALLGIAPQAVRALVVRSHTRAALMERSTTHQEQ